MIVNYADVTELAESLIGAATDSEDRVNALLQHAGTQIEAAAVATAPVKTGRLRGSIRMIASHMRVLIGPDVSVAPHGPFVEYGTGTMGEFPGSAYIIKPKQAKVLAFKVGGQQVFARQVKHPGIRAHPYMRPALMQWVDSLGEDAVKVGVELIQGPKR